MGIKKLKDLFIKSNGASKKVSSLSIASNKEKLMEAAKSNVQKKEHNKADNFQSKREVEQLRNAINNKLKDPSMAKKAARILEEMITPKK